MAVDLWKGKGQLAVDRRLAMWTDKVVGNSNAVVDFYREAGVPDDRLAMIPSGIGDEEPPEVDPAAVRAEFGFAAGSPLAIFVGRLAPQKAVDDLLAALDLLQHTEPDLRTLIVGDGPLREQLRAKAHAFTLDDAVRFLGHRDDVPRLLAATDLLVLPSLYEGLPNVVLEAMRFRKPVVATAAPGTTEVVVDGETGRLVPMHDFVALARGDPRADPRPRPCATDGRGGPVAGRGRVPGGVDGGAVRGTLRGDRAGERPQCRLIRTPSGCYNSSSEQPRCLRRRSVRSGFLRDRPSAPSSDQFRDAPIQVGLRVAEYTSRTPR